MSQLCGSICLVAADGDLPKNGRFQGSSLRLARFLAGLGWQVHILDCSRLADLRGFRLRRRTLERQGIAYSALEHTHVPLHLRLPAQGFSSEDVERSDRVRYALSQLQASCAFDLVQFPERQGLGFRTIQAKRAALEFADIGIIVRLEGLACQRREQTEHWPDHLGEFLLDYLELYGFEHADFQISSSRALLRDARRRGWQISRDTAILDEASYEHPASAVGDAVMLNRRFNGHALDVGGRDESVMLTPPTIRALAAADYYAEVLRQTRAGANRVETRTQTQPRVSVVVPHFNLGAYLPATLASLAAQTHANTEVLVIDDGSTDPASLQVFAEQERRYPLFHFWRRHRSGVSATRNFGLEHATGEFYIAVDADNVAMPHMVERYVQALLANPEYSVMTSYFLGFKTDADLEAQRYCKVHRPTGGPSWLSSLVDIYGDTCGIFRTADLRAAGGYDVQQQNGHEDWELYSRLSSMGYQLDVVPEPLYYYRYRNDARSKQINRYRSHRCVLETLAKHAELDCRERLTLYAALLGLHERCEKQAARLANPACRLALKANRFVKKFPRTLRLVKTLLGIGRPED